MLTYIRAEMLQPLDVILLRGKRPFEKKTAGYLGGSYSHAEIVVNKTMRFDSVKYGIRFRPVKFSKCKAHDNHIYFLEKIDKFAIFDVYRHKNLKDINKNRLEVFQRDLIETLIPFHLDQYPSVKTFHGIINKLRPDKMIFAKILLKAYEPVEGKKIIPGPFCSELVAKVFDYLKLELFSSDQEAKLISPNDLAKSKLQKLEDETYKLTEADLQGLDELRLLKYANMPYELSKIVKEEYRERQKLKKIYKKLEDTRNEIQEIRDSLDTYLKDKKKAVRLWKKIVSNLLNVFNEIETSPGYGGQRDIEFYKAYISKKLIFIQSILTKMPSEFCQMKESKKFLIEGLDSIIRNIGADEYFTYAREALTPIENFQLIFDYDKKFWDIIGKIERCLPMCGGFNDPKQCKIYVKEINKFYEKDSLKLFCELHGIDAKLVQNHINPWCP